MTITKWDHRFLDLANLISTWSKDPSTGVGAVIVRPDKTVASVGFNGFPMGMEDKVEYLENRDEKYSRVVHGEMNAILFAREPIKGYTLYTTLLPCDRCFVHVAQAGIVRVVSEKCPPGEKADRWEPAFKKVRQYAKEVGIEIREVE